MSKTNYDCADKLSQTTSVPSLAIGRMRDVQILTSRIEELAVRLVGPVPEASGTSGTCILSAGLLGELEDASRYLVDSLIDAHAALDRIEKSL